MAELKEFLKRNDIDHDRIDFFLYNTLILTAIDRIIKGIKDPEKKKRLIEEFRKTPKKSEILIIDKLIKKYLDLSYSVKEKEIIKLYIKNFLEVPEKRSQFLTKKELSSLLKKQENRCKFCGSDIISQGYVIDHIFPYSLGGKNTISNFQLLCKRCNLKKYNKILSTLHILPIKSQN